MTSEELDEKHYVEYFLSGTNYFFIAFELVLSFILVINLIVLCRELLNYFHILFDDMNAEDLPLTIIKNNFSVIELIMASIIIYFLMMGIYEIFIKDRFTYRFWVDKNYKEINLAKFKKYLSGPFLLSVSSTVVIILLSSIIELYQIGKGSIPLDSANAIEAGLVQITGILVISIALLCLGKFMLIEKDFE
nr:hypothetical protein [uncultured Methanospirillum sp.]